MASREMSLDFAMHMEAMLRDFSPTHVTQVTFTGYLLTGKHISRSNVDVMTGSQNWRDEKCRRSSRLRSFLICHRLFSRPSEWRHDFRIPNPTPNSSAVDQAPKRNPVQSFVDRNLGVVLRRPLVSKPAGEMCPLYGQSVLLVTRLQRRH